LENRSVSFGADWLGKLKMVLQCAALFSIFIALESWKWSDAAAQRFAMIRDGLIWAMLGATALSGLQYLWRATLIMKNEMEL
jgi:phosphatidylglycerophosphate synthase